MTSIVNHDIAEKIRHEVSGLGALTSLTGEVIDRGYTDPILVDVVATVSGHKFLCSNSDDGKIRYFESGSEVDLPAPVNYFNDTPFAAQTAKLIAMMEKDYTDGVHTRHFRKNLWYWGFITPGLLIPALDALDKQMSPISLFGLALVFVGMIMNPYRPDSSFLGEPAIHDMDISEDLTGDGEFAQFKDQLARFAARHGVRFVGELQGVVAVDTGYLMFSGSRPGKDKLSWFAVNSSATDVLRVVDYNPFMFSYKPMSAQESIKDTETATV